MILTCRQVCVWGVCVCVSMCVCVRVSWWHTTGLGQAAEGRAPGRRRWPCAPNPHPRGSPHAARARLPADSLQPLTCAPSSADTYMRFCGLRSRCAMPSACRCATPSATCRKMARASCSRSCGEVAMWSNSSPPARGAGRREARGHAGRVGEARGAAARLANCAATCRLLSSQAASMQPAHFLPAPPTLHQVHHQLDAAVLIEKVVVQAGDGGVPADGGSSRSRSRRRRRRRGALGAHPLARRRQRACRGGRPPGLAAAVPPALTASWRRSAGCAARCAWPRWRLGSCAGGS